MQTYEQFLRLKNNMATVNLTDATLFDSATLFQEMAILNKNAVAKAQNAFQFIHQHNINGVLIGGMAVSHYVHDRPLTPDVDFLVANFDEVIELLKQEKITYQALASSGAYSGVQVPLIDADFLDANQEGEEKLFNSYILKTAQSTNIGGVSFAMIDPAVLAIQKLCIGREKDLHDAFKLLTVVSKDAVKNHLKALKNSLFGDIDAKTIWSYAQAMSK